MVNPYGNTWVGTGTADGRPFVQGNVHCEGNTNPPAAKKIMVDSGAAVTCIDMGNFLTQQTFGGTPQPAPAGTPQAGGGTGAFLGFTITFPVWNPNTDTWEEIICDMPINVLPTRKLPVPCILLGQDQKRKFGCELPGPIAVEPGFLFNDYVFTGGVVRYND